MLAPITYKGKRYRYKARYQEEFGSFTTEDEERYPVIEEALDRYSRGRGRVPDPVPEWGEKEMIRYRGWQVFRNSRQMPELYASLFDVEEL